MAQPKHASANALTLALDLDGIAVIQPRPLLVADRSAERVLGLTVRAWRKVARAMLTAGLPVTDTADGLTALVADVELYMAKHAPKAELRERTKREAADNDDTDIGRDLGRHAA